MTQTSIRALSTEALISSRIASTDHVRVEFLRCGSATTLEWSVARPEVSLMWVRDKGSNARFTLAGRQSDSITPGRANFWFFPEGSDAHGELTGKGAYDCAGVFVDPSFLPSTVKDSWPNQSPAFRTMRSAGRSTRWQANWRSLTGYCRCSPRAGRCKRSPM